MKSNFFLVLILSISLSISAFAQKHTGTAYKTSLGVKFYPGGITFKQALSKGASVEAIGYFWNGNRITGLYEMHYKIEGLGGLRWYFGPGVHVSLYDKSHYSGNAYFGVDGVIGLDWKVKGTPINLSLDWQPSFELGEGAGFGGSWGGLSVRYVFK